MNTNRKYFYALTLLIMIIGAIFSYRVVEAKKTNLKQEVQKVTASYEVLFADEDKAMIIENLDSKQYKNAGLSRENLPETIDQNEFDQWQTVLDNQFKNQEQAKESVLNLIEEIDGKPYVTTGLSEENFISAKESIGEPFNETYQSSLLSRVSILESDWKQIHSVEEKITEYTETLNASSSKSITAEDWENLEQRIAEVIHPKMKENFSEQFDTLSDKWEELEEQRQAEEKKQAEKEKAAEKLSKKEDQPVEEITSSSNTRSKKNTIKNPSNTSSNQSSNEKKTNQPVHKAKSEPKPSPKPSPKASPKASIGPNKIGVNGIYKNYTNYGNSTTAHYQSGIDAGLIIGGFSHFNGNDNETTYFAGHNPGIMNFMEQGIHLGAVVTVTDSSSEQFTYKMIDKVDVDDVGKGMLDSIGKSAIDAYYYGTGTESILIQFCNTNNGLMSFWYGVPI